MGIVAWGPLQLTSRVVTRTKTREIIERRRGIGLYVLFNKLLTFSPLTSQGIGTIFTLSGCGIPKSDFTPNGLDSNSVSITRVCGKKFFLGTGCGVWGVGCGVLPVLRRLIT